MYTITKVLKVIEMSKPCDLSSLGCSLGVIQELALDPTQFDLIPDPGESEVVKSSSFFGHVWKVYSDFLEHFPLPCIPLPCTLPFEDEENRLTRTLGNIRKEFEKALQEIQQVDEQYRSGLLEKSSDRA